MPGDPALLTVGATILGALGVMGLVTGWVDGRVARVPLVSAIAAAALFAWLWAAGDGDFGPMSIPLAFVEMTARIVR